MRSRIREYMVCKNCEKHLCLNCHIQLITATENLNPKSGFCFDFHFCRAFLMNFEIAFCLLLWYKDRSTNPFSLELNLELVSPTYLTTSMYNILIITIYKQSVHSRRNQGVPLTWFQSRRILSSLAWKLCTDRDRNCKTAIWRFFFFREKK